MTAPARNQFATQAEERSGAEAARSTASFGDFADSTVVAGWTSSERVICFVLMLATLSFIPLVTKGGDALSAGQGSLRGAMELAGLLAAIAIVAIQFRNSRVVRRVLSLHSVMLLSSFSALAMLSAAWSQGPLLSLVKGFELGAIAVLCALIVAALDGQHGPRCCLERILATGLLIVIGLLLLANVWLYGELLPRMGDRDRLALGPANVLNGAELLTVTVVAVVASDFRNVTKLLLLPVLFVMLWWTNARGSITATFCAIGVASSLKIRRRDYRLALFAVAGCVVLLTALFVNDKLARWADELLPDDSATLNGRTDLWQYTVDQIYESPVIGHGYFANRFVLLKKFDWAGHAHNSFLEIGLSNGLSGLLLLAAFVGYALYLCIKTGDQLLILALISCVIQGFLNPILFVPGLPMLVLMLAMVRSEAAMHGGLM